MINTIENIDFKGKRVIIRCDLNVPIKNNIILDDTRIISSIKTIKYVLKTAEKVIILSHLGRIKSEEDKKNNSLKVVCERLEEIIDEKIVFCNYDETIYKKVKENKIVMFENTRFFDLDDKKESNNDVELSKFFSSFGDVFINDAFGTCHRANASNVGISNFLPTYLGFLIIEEIKMLNIVKDNPKRPFIVIMGGAKVTDKITLINKLIDKVDKLIITGAMAFTFFKAKNINVGKSIVDEESISFCEKLLNKYESKIVLPLDIYTGLEIKNDTKKSLRDINYINNDEIGLDIGPKTLNYFENELKDAKTVFLNGPSGMFEFENFSSGTYGLLKILSNIDASVIIGGGDSASAAKKSGYKFTHISTGGGASLEYIEGKKLPGIEIGVNHEEV